jgi:hypothetical protein
MASASGVLGFTEPAGSKNLTGLRIVSEHHRRLYRSVGTATGRHVHAPPVRDAGTPSGVCYDIVAQTRNDVENLL